MAKLTIRRVFESILLLALFLSGVRATVDPDMWWHLRTGEWILEHGIPTRDVFSFTKLGAPWVAQEWLSDALMWLLHQATSLTGLSLIFGGVVAVTFWLVYLSCPGRPYLAGFVVALGVFTAKPYIGVRPQVFNLLFLAGFIFIVEGFRTGRFSRRTLYLLPLLTVVWVNLHSGYLLGVVVLAVYAVGEALEAKFGRRAITAPLPWGHIKALGAVAVASFGAALINPRGFRLWTYPFETLTSESASQIIIEWQSPDFHEFRFQLFAFMVVLGLAAWIWSRARPHWAEILLFAGSAGAGLLSRRNIPLFVVAVTPIIARHLLAAFEGKRVHSLLSGSAAPPRVTARSGALNAAVIALVVVAGIVWAGDRIEGNAEAIESNFPVAAVDFIEDQGLTDGAVFNDYAWGGYLIWRGIPVFVDGRADMYGDEFLFFFLQTAAAEEDWREPLEAFDVSYAVTARDRRLATLLDASPEWANVYTDDVAKVFVRA